MTEVRWSSHDGGFVRRVVVREANGVIVFDSGDIEVNGVFELPAGVLRPGVTYEIRDEASVAPMWSTFSVNPPLS